MLPREGTAADKALRAFETWPEGTWLLAEDVAETAGITEQEARGATTWLTGRGFLRSRQPAGCQLQHALISLATVRDFRRWRDEQEASKLAKGRR